MSTILNYFLEVLFDATWAVRWRIRRVCALSGGGKKCEYELVAVRGLGWSTVSRHLSVLRDAGVLAEEKRGLQVFCRPRLGCVARFLECLESPQRHPEFAAPGCGDARGHLRR